jgi:hypothetical protein
MTGRRIAKWSGRCAKYTSTVDFAAHLMAHQNLCDRSWYSHPCPEWRVAASIIDKSEVARSCDVWGPKCDKAKIAQSRSEDKLKAVRALLKTHGVEVDDSMAKRGAALCRQKVQPVAYRMPLRERGR